MTFINLGCDLDARGEQLGVTDSAVIDALGDQLPQLDVLVCNSGIVSNNPAEDIDYDESDQVIAVNLTGVCLTCRKLGVRMLEVSKGRIIDIGSMSGQSVNVPKGLRWR